VKATGSLGGESCSMENVLGYKAQKNVICIMLMGHGVYSSLQNNKSVYTNKQKTLKSRTTKNM
jgi:hypothetical protein